MGIFITVEGPNGVGKSTFINSFTGRACTKTGNKPGVTKGKQWIRLNKNVELQFQTKVIFSRQAYPILKKRCMEM